MVPRVLDRGDRAHVASLLGQDPVLNVFVASRVEAGVLTRGASGELWGYPSRTPRSLLHVGANLVPVGTDADARAAFVARLGQARTFCAIVGRREEVLPLWTALGERWGRSYADARAVRERQPVLAMGERSPIRPDARVRPIGHSDGESYFSAAVAMYTEELDEDPLETNPYGYRRYVESLIDQGRAFGIVEDGEVVFKADIGAVGAGVAQVQGVWLHPRLRGRGLAAGAMAAVTNEIVGRGQVASLYVNDYNAPALATYARCGYTQRGVFTTVLY